MLMRRQEPRGSMGLISRVSPGHTISHRRSIFHFVDSPVDKIIRVQGRMGLAGVTAG